MTDTPDDMTDIKAERDAREGDTRSDLEQAVAARSDAIERGEGGEEPAIFTDTGLPDGVGGTGGVVKNQDDDAQ